MGFFREYKLSQKVLGSFGVALFCAAVAGSCYWASPAVAQDGGQSGNAVATKNPLKLGVVDFNRLLEAHSDFEKLQLLDEQIGVLQQELRFLPLSDQRLAADTGRKRMQQEVDKARRELETEYKRVNAEMAGFSASLAAHLDSEGRALQEHYRGVLQQRMAALTSHQPPALSKDIKAKMDAFVADLAAVREQRVVARRLELERASQVKLDAERNRVDAAIAAYDSEIMRINQEKRLNLQLQLQTVDTPEEEAALQKQLSDLGDEEAQLKEARHKQLRAEYEALAERERQAVDSELQTFESKLSAEARAQAVAKRDELVGQLPAAPDRQATQAVAQAEVEKIKAAIDAEMRAKQAEMRLTMEARGREAKSKLEAKQAKIEKRLVAVQKRMADMVEKSAENVSDVTKQKMEDTKAKIDELMKQRQALYDSMVADLSGIVGQVAEKRNIPSVVGAYVVNVDCVDITDYAMVAVKNAAH